jgi:carnitine monooxygenase subunit
VTGHRTAELRRPDRLASATQLEDIGLVESVQRGMATPAFERGRIVYDPASSGLSEHGVHHFHGLVPDAYRAGVGSPRAVPARARVAL